VAANHPELPVERIGIRREDGSLQADFSLTPRFSEVPGRPGVCETIPISTVFAWTGRPLKRANNRKANQKGFALPVKKRHLMCMNATLLEPKKLRPAIIQRIETMDDESLLVLHRVLLIVEKEGLWRELSAEAEQDRGSGKLDRLPEIIREARAELRQG